MVDPNLNFDWDMWDAVFGQHLPVADELMELDPVSGLDFANLGNPGNPTAHVNPSPLTAVNQPIAWADDGYISPGMSPSDWVGYC